jgi:hypothetical protein
LFSILKVAVPAVFLTLPAFGGLILLGPEDFGGTGLGNVNTALTINSNTGTAQGCVGFVGGATGTGSSFCNDLLTGTTNEQALNNTFTLGGLGVTDLADIRVVLNASEPAGSGITLETLTLTFINPTVGAPNDGIIATAELDASQVVFPDTATGAGNSGFVFGITAAQQTSIGTTLAASGLTFADLRVGLVAQVSGEDGGLETFYIARTADPGDPGDPIPEPGTYVTLAAGLLGLAMWRRRARA